MTSIELCTALVRATLVTAAAVGLAWLLLSGLRISSPRVHRVAWALALAPGWLLWPWTWQIETPPPETARAISLGGMPSSAWAWTSEGITQPQQSTLEVPLAMVSPTAMATQAALAVWTFGVAALVIRSARRYGQVARTLPLGSPPDSAWRRQWRRQLKAAGVRRRVELRTTDRLGPLLCFVPFFYLVLVPRALWSVLSDPERESILRHELAHLVRRDLWKSLAVRILALPQWFNPLAWLAVRRFDEAGEWACDDAAARATAGGDLALANSLLRAAEFISAVPCGAAALHGGVLSRRIRRLAAPRIKEDSTMKKLIVLSLLAAVAAVQLVRIERVAAESSGRRPSARAKRFADSAAPPRGVRRKEYNEAAWPRYVIEPPDILLIESVKFVPKSPYRIESFDSVLIRAVGAFPEQPIDDAYNVDPNGDVNLGPTYGRVKIAGLTIDEAQKRVRDKLDEILADVDVSITLAAAAGVQQISGQHLVAMDGRVNLGVYGSVFVAGLTIEETRAEIELHLADRIEKPQVSVDVLAYNSKVFYVINKGGGAGDEVTRLPITGNETVLDAVSAIGGVRKVADTKIWIVRPPVSATGVEAILPVEWKDISSGTSTATNYQLIAGDRLFIEASAQKLVQPAPAPQPTPILPAPAAAQAALAPLAAPTAQPAATPTPALPATPLTPATPTTPVSPPKLPATATRTWPAAPAKPPAPSAAPDQVVFNIVILEDRQGTLAEFKDLRESGFMVGDTTTTLGALRVFEKHKLIKRTADPSIICEVGREARFELGSQPVDDLSPDEGVRVEVATRRLTPSIIVFSLSASVNGRVKEVQTALDKNERQTAIMRVGPRRDESDAGGKSERVAYVVVTPEWVR